jgi:hypothetical protein
MISEPLSQPCSEILAETAIAHKVTLDISVLE